MTTRAKKAFLRIVEKTHIPKLRDGTRHDRNLHQFEFVVVRDALMELGLNFKDAELMAGKYHGCARKRFNMAASELGYLG